jgi:predicted ABC-type transport system involved in lysophospholipase L1 biosynthesis ATPase subunit
VRSQITSLITGSSNLRDRSAYASIARHGIAKKPAEFWQEPPWKTGLTAALCIPLLHGGSINGRYLLVQQPQLIARDIYKSFRMGARRIEVLGGISMDIAHNETVFLSGASGAGKTTLLYTLAGLERPESGTVKFEGRKLYSGPSTAEARLRNEKMGFVFQGYFLLPELTALENVLLPALIGRRTMRGEAEESLTAVGLADRMHHLPSELSGGEQQRVAIARALTNNPDIIFADEPTGNLDSKTGDAIMDLLLNLARDRNKTLLVVTHDIRLATRGDRQLHIKDGVLH